MHTFEKNFNLNELYPSCYTSSNEVQRHVTQIKTQTPPSSGRVLTVAASGDQAIFYQIAGYSHIDTFDILPLAGTIQDIKISAIRNMPRNAYIELVNNLHTNPSLDRWRSMLDPIYSELHPTSRDIIDNCPRRHIMLAGTCAATRPYNYPTDSEYATLQKTIRSPDFVATNITDVHTAYKSEYDIINVSNIFDKFKCPNPNDDIKTIFNLCDMLRPNGILLILFQMPMKPLDYKKIAQYISLQGKKQFIGCNGHNSRIMPHRTPAAWIQRTK